MTEEGYWERQIYSSTFFLQCQWNLFNYKAEIGCLFILLCLSVILTFTTTCAEVASHINHQQFYQVVYQLRTFIIKTKSFRYFIPRIFYRICFRCPWCSWKLYLQQLKKDLSTFCFSMSTFQKIWAKMIRRKPESDSNKRIIFIINPVVPIKIFSKFDQKYLTLQRIQS